MADIFELFKKIAAEQKSAQTAPARVIVGLGNPGAQYASTRHNAGFMAVTRIAEKAGASSWRMRFHAEIAECAFAGERVLLVRPQTFMNNSGQAVREILDWYKLTAENLIVIYDDISLEPGRLRIRKKGSDGGHNGIKSILYHVGTDVFPRIKIGVGAKPNPEYDLADWVLGKFPEEVLPAMRDVMERACGAAELIVKEGCDAAASRYNASVFAPDTGEEEARK